MWPVYHKTPCLSVSQQCCLLAWIRTKLFSFFSGDGQSVRRRRWSSAPPQHKRQLRRLLMPTIILLPYLPLSFPSPGNCVLMLFFSFSLLPFWSCKGAECVFCFLFECIFCFYAWFWCRICCVDDNSGDEDQADVLNGYSEGKGNLMPWKKLLLLLQCLYITLRIIVESIVLLHHWKYADTDLWTVQTCGIWRNKGPISTLQ